MVADENNAFDMNLDQELFYVGSDKGSTTNQVGMYADIRLYGDRNTGDGNTLSLYVAAGKVVTSVDIEWSAHTNPPQTAVFKYGAEEVTLTEDADLTGMYGKADLSINGFAIKMLQLAAKRMLKFVLNQFASYLLMETQPQYYRVNPPQNNLLNQQPLLNF